MRDKTRVVLTENEKKLKLLTENEKKLKLLTENEKKLKDISGGATTWPLKAVLCRKLSRDDPE